MKIQIEYVAMLDVKGFRSGQAIELPDAATLGDLLDRLNVAPSHRTSVTPFVNDERATLATRLRDGDRVFITLPISGG